MVDPVRRIARPCRSVRERIRQRDDYRCHWHGGPVFAQPATRGARSLDAATLDHLTPLIRGGTNDDANLVTSCEACNRIKAHWSVGEFLAWVHAVAARHPLPAREASNV